MAPAADNTGAFTVSLMTFSPGIRGIQRSFKLRSVTFQGRLWLLAKDAAKALGTPVNSFRQRCQSSLEGAAWGYATVPDKSGRPAMMMLVAVDDLARFLTSARTRQGRMFRRWLDGLTHPQAVL
ncbi:hypothetical protein [Methylorubrum populi]|uniref:hypothetical protein n=1 Tax=Methylorubrum populi TaxID=223967 RepID=UPI000DB4D9D1|nr:hypothetical protein [Methylorubrum populi]PZP67933.1 MAG: hypothetical protein DI590_18860 [Methylorubrum populi]